MTIKKKLIKTETKEVDDTPKKPCTDCGGLKVIGSFYSSDSPYDKDGRMNICKICLKKNINYDKQETIDSVLIAMNRPFLIHIWNNAIDEANRTGKDLFGIYCKNVMFNFKDYTWKDSVFKQKSIDTVKSTDEYNESNQVITLHNEFRLTDALIDKWGDGYTPEEYKSFERKYNMLKNNYQEKTAMHTEALLTYIRYRAKEELSTAQGDSKAAKEWGTLAKDAATAAKINPSQLSKSDLTDGLDTFGQLVRSVEQAVDIIPILPRFKEKPQDKVDFTLWCYINYIRDLKGLPLVEFKEIYNFYEVRKKEYENSQSDDEGEF